MSARPGVTEPAEAHAAILLREDRADDMAELGRLRSDSGVVLVDRLEDQHDGLRRLHGDDRDEAPRWAYYPWRRAAVRVLGPNSFRRLRLDRNRNKITEDEQARLDRVAVGVVGLSVGHAVAHTIALEGLCGAIRLADFDVLELSNLNRIPATLFDLGVNKAVLAARRIAEVDPYCRVEVWHAGVGTGTVAEFLDGLDIVIDECDSLDVKVRLRVEAAMQRLPVLMQTSDRGLVDVERFDLEPDRSPFHGLLGDVDPEALETLSNRDKVPHVLRILGSEELSTRLAASMLEVDETLETWPQLASDVALGGAAVAVAVRRIVLGAPLRSGRCRIDLDDHLDGLETPEPPREEQAVPLPEGRDATGPVDAVLDAATRAPSGGNSQPWSMTVDARRITFALAPEPAPVAMDIHRRGSRVALGAAFYNARVAAAAHGILGPAVVHPGPDSDSGVAAILELGTGTDPVLAARYGPMLARTTNRCPSAGRGLDAEEAGALHDAAAREGGRIEVFDDPAVLGEFAAVLAASDRIRYLDRALRRDMVGELRRPGEEDSDTGIEIATLGLDAAEAAVLDVVLRHDVLDQLHDWGLGGGLGRITRDRVRGSAALVVVPTSGRAPADYVRAGSVVESVWVQAQASGLAVQPISPVFLYADSREDLELLTPAYADELEVLHDKFTGMLTLAENDGTALVLRVGRTDRESGRSRRRADRVQVVRYH